MRVATLLAAAVMCGAANNSMACPDYQVEPTYGEIDLSEGFEPDPYRHRIEAGGKFNLIDCGIDEEGWVAEAPDFDLYYETSGELPLVISVTSGADTILLVNDPEGYWWYDDDSGEDGSGARIVIDRPESGLYDIWVGTYERTRATPGTLYISEWD